jgi:hypothetical protein
VLETSGINGLLENDKIMVQKGNPTKTFTSFISDPRNKQDRLCDAMISLAIPIPDSFSKKPKN